MIDFNEVQALTFDCYGTLIDWESGITAALAPVLRDRGAIPFSVDQLLQAYAAAESRIESGPYLPYRQVLAQVTRELADQFRATLAPGDDALLVSSIRNWPAFPDTAAALAALSNRFKLIILSNIDRDLFEFSRPKLGVVFADIITAEDVRANKPAPNHFREVLNRTGLSPRQIGHVAQSLYHDIAVASPLGMQTVWINRRHNQPGPGATPPATATADLVLPSLAELARIAL